MGVIDATAEQMHTARTVQTRCLTHAGMQSFAPCKVVLAGAEAA